MSVYCSCNGRCWPNTANLTDRVLFCPEHSTVYKENCSYVCCRPKIKVTNLVQCNKCKLIYAGILIPENSQNICYQCLRSQTPDLKSSRIFTSHMQQSQINEIINQLAQLCPRCECKKTRLCIQENCKQNKVYCILCDSKLHLTHRTNQIRSLCIDKEYLKSYQQVIEIDLSKLKEYIAKQHQRCSQVINQFAQMAQKFTANIQQIDAILKQSRQNWLSKLNQCIDNFSNSQIALNEARKIFQQCLQKLSFWEKENYSSRLKSFQVTQNLLTKFDKSILRSSQANYGHNTNQTIQKLVKVKQKLCIQKVFRQNPIEHFISKSKSDIELSMTHFTKWGRNISINSISNRELPFNRIFIDKIDSIHRLNLQYSIGKSIRFECPRLVELHTPFHFFQFPHKNLLSLTLDLSGYKKEISDFSIKKLPKSLVTLRLQCTQSNKLDVQSLNSLPNLNYLVLESSCLNNSQKKNVLNIAIKNKFRMVCFVKKSSERKKIKMIGNWQYKFETVRYHQFNKLKRHYEIYRRKLHQMMSICRSGLNRRLPSIFKENVLQITQNQNQIDIEKQLK